MTGSETNPTAENPQVNPSVSVESVGLNSSDKGQPYDSPPETSTTNATSSMAPSREKTPQPDSPTEKPDLTCGNSPAATRQNLTWPSAPAWAARWQAKIDAGRLPEHRADAAWRALRAAVNKARLDHDAADAVFTEAAGWLVERANRIAPALPPKPRSKPQPVVDLRGNQIADALDPEEYA